MDDGWLARHFHFHGCSTLVRSGKRPQTPPPFLTSQLVYICIHISFYCIVYCYICCCKYYVMLCYIFFVYIIDIESLLLLYICIHIYIYILLFIILIMIHYCTYLHYYQYSSLLLSSRLLSLLLSSLVLLSIILVTITITCLYTDFLPWFPLRTANLSLNPKDPKSGLNSHWFPWGDKLINAIQ